jgi:hypothetical protein
MHCIINRDAENEKKILGFCRDAARCVFAVGPIHVCIEKRALGTYHPERRYAGAHVSTVDCASYNLRLFR